MDIKDDTSIYGVGLVTLTNVCICIAIVIIFCFVRSFDRNIYEPKTYMLASDKQIPPPPQGFFAWIIPTWKIPESYVYQVAGLDALMFLKFLKAAMFLFFFFTVASFIVLVPINVVERLNKDSTVSFKKSGLEILTMNGTDDNHYQWAHVSCLVLFVFSVVFLLYKSVFEYAELRQDGILKPEHSLTIKARTLLVASIPKHMNTKKQLFDLFNIFPGGVKHVFVNRTVGSLSTLTAQRDSMHFKLEQVMTRWIALNVKEKIKQNGANPYQPPPRITHRLGFLGLYGKKVDSIDFYLNNVLSLNRSINEIRENRNNLPVQESAFILFNSQIGAHVAAQSLVSNHVMFFNPRYVESAPEDIIWSNLDLSAVQFMIRQKICLVIAIIIAVLWFIPSGIVSGFSKLEKIATVLPFIEDILPSSPSFRGYIQAALPPVFSGILTAMVPIIYTILSTFEGHPRSGDVQLSVMTKYFWFLVSTILLASTIGSTFSDVLSQIEKIRKDTTYIIEVLADKLPPASNFFINLVFLKALVSSSQELLQVVNLIKRRLIVKLFVSSPRKHLQVIEMDSITWGTLWPEHTLVFSIGLLYSILAPVSNFAMSIYFLMFYMVFKYQILYVYQTEKDQAQGMFFMKAVSQIFVGLYIFLGTFAGMMLSQKKQGVAKLIVTLIVLFLTICSHVFLVDKYDAVVKFIPIQKALETSSTNNQPSPNTFSIEMENTSETIPLRKMPHPSDYINPVIDSTGVQKTEHSAPPDGLSLEDYFAHPDLIDPQPILWAPQDQNGFSEYERIQVVKQGSNFIQFDTHGATMDSNGVIGLTKFSYPEHAQANIF